MSDPTNDIIEPEDSESVSPAPISPAERAADEQFEADRSAAANDADSEVPVPIAMEPAEIDERAKVVEALNRGEQLP